METKNKKFKWEKVGKVYGAKNGYTHGDWTIERGDSAAVTMWRVFKKGDNRKTITWNLRDAKQYAENRNY